MPGADVDLGFAAWLKADALFTSADDATNVARFPTQGSSTEITTCLGTKAGADAEGARQAGFLGGGAIVKDKVIVMGRRKDMAGKAWTLAGDRMGYEAGGAAAYVLGAQENPNGTTTLTVLKKLT